MDRPIHILWHWFTMGPYHFARMASIAHQPGVRLTVIETTANDDHDWIRGALAESFDLITLSTRPLSGTTHRNAARAYSRALDEYAPDIVVESGYAELHSLHALLCHRANYPRVRTLLWSETTAEDRRRSPLREGVKSLIAAEFEGAFVAGSRHAEYVLNLGMAPDAIQIVGNCVDNEFFQQQAARVRARGSAPAPYFLFVGRFIPEKNLPLLIRSYAKYRRLAPADPYDLILVGSGPEEARLRDLIRELGVEGVQFAGSKQIEDLPEYYARAACLVLPSTSEPWGLVVNEAMASGAPVLASNACGSARDLLISGKTGFLFSPDDEEDLADRLQWIAAHPREAAEMGSAAQQHVQSMGLETYAQRVVRHIKNVLDRTDGRAGRRVRSKIVRNLTATAAIFA